MDKDIWIVKVNDYRKFCVRLYVELYRGNDYYSTVYYDVRNDKFKAISGKYPLLFSLSLLLVY
jgi:hypothetical protein